MNFRLRQLFASVVLASAVAACATGSSVVTGATRTAIAPSSVQLYPQPPAEYEVIGVVKASSKSGWTEQGSMDYAVEELKKQAAAIGANGVLLKAVAGRYSAIVVGDAIYVPR